jgi:WD40 repeat protein
MLMDLGDRRAVSIAPAPRPVGTTAFRALPDGVARLWDDGLVTLIDGSGTTLQELHAHGAPVRDVVVAPDATWAVTLGDDAVVRRWPIERSTGRWSAPETLSGHLAAVVGGAVDAEGETLFTVARDNTVIAWDMTLDGVVNMERVQRGSADPAAWIEDACAVVGRDLRPGEWTRYLSDRPWQPTCSDLP